MIVEDVTNNYTKILTKASKVYNRYGSFSVDCFKLIIPFSVLFILIGALIGLPFHKNMFNLFSLFSSSKGWDFDWLLIWGGLGAGIGSALYFIKIFGFRLYEYLYAYLKPKKIYTNNQDFRKREMVFKKITVKGIVSQEL